jgi:hypothetical protein
MTRLIRAAVLGLLSTATAAAAADEEGKADQAPPSPAFPIAIRPFAAVVGGLKGELNLTRPGVVRENRLTTLAVSRFGLRAELADWISAESELEANAGFHGTSAWEGQAALQVRNQLVRLSGARWKVELGRVTDEASVDFHSAHVADLLLTDAPTRDPFLFTGFNRGNGILGTFEVVPGLRLGLTLNAANPVAMTGSLPVGGTFNVFERFYLVPFQAVNQVANHFPDDTFHMMLLSPSVLFASPAVEARGEVQLYQVNTNTTRADDHYIYGFNARAAVRARLLDGRLLPFLNLAFDRNDILDPMTARVIPDKYSSLTAGAGVDYQYSGENGVGVQYVRVQHRQGGGVITVRQYANLGTTFWLTPAVSLGGRLSALLKNELGSGLPVEGELAATASVRALLQ